MLQNKHKIAWLCLVICCASILANPRRAKRQVAGGRTDIAETEFPALFDKVSEALARLATQKNGATLNLVEIKSAQKQTVSGRKYYINAKITLTNNDEKICDFEIWEQPWLEFQKFDATCEDQEYQVVQEGKKNNRQARSIGGGVTDLEADDLAYVEQLVTESLVQLGGQAASPNYKLVGIKDAKKQVVSGRKFLVNAELSLDQAENKICDLEIWEQLWNDFRETTVKCDGNEYKVVKNGRAKRSIGKPLLDVDENRFDVENDMEITNAFESFKLSFNRTYGQNDYEHAMRYRIFKQNLFLIEQLNKFEMGTAEYGITEFSDLTSQEYFQRTGLKAREGAENRIPNLQAEIPDIKLPTSFDWRDKNAVTPVKNQGNCGSCWAFSVTGNIEGVHVAQGGSLESYSEQELLDCDTVDGACNGGLPDDAYKAIERIGGLETENAYPYEAHKGKCHYDPSLKRVAVKGAVDLPKEEEAIAKYLVENGPVSIGINANGMQFYHRGVSRPWKALCRADSLDHGVLIVGFGEETGKKNKILPYWIVKNSWGPKWGEQGYYRVYRGDNTCGVASMASSAILE